MTLDRDGDDLAALFPDRPALTKEDLQRRMAGLRFTHSADPRLHFGMLAPLGWTWRDPRQAGSPPGLLLSVVDSVDRSPARAEISVTADELRREVSPAEWVKNRLERAGHTLLAQREAYGPIGASADLLTEREGPEGRLLARTNMVKDASRIFTLTCHAREDLYPVLADEFFAALASFQLLHPERAPLAEPLRSFSDIHPAVFGFSYPASWSLDHEAASPEASDVRLDNLDGDRCAARIHIRARAQHRPRQMAGEFLELMAAKGIQVEPADLTPCDPPEGFARAWSLLAPATFGGEALELRAMVMEGEGEAEGTALLLGLGGPARAASPDWWAINKRAFEIVRDSIYAV